MANLQHFGTSWPSWKTRFRNVKRLKNYKDMAKLVTDTEEAREFFNNLGISRLAVTLTAIFIHKTHCLL